MHPHDCMVDMQQQQSSQACSGDGGEGGDGLTAARGYGEAAAAHQSAPIAPASPHAPQPHSSRAPQLDSPTSASSASIERQNESKRAAASHALQPPGLAMDSAQPRVQPIGSHTIAAATAAATAAVASHACSCQVAGAVTTLCSCAAVKPLPAGSVPPASPTAALTTGGAHARSSSKSKVQLQVVTDPSRMQQAATMGSESRKGGRGSTVEAMPSPLMFHLELTTPAASPSPSPSPQTHAGGRSTSTSIGSGGSSGCSAQSAADMSRRSHSDVSDATGCRSRASIFLAGGWGDAITTYDHTTQQGPSAHLSAELLQLQQQSLGHHHHLHASGSTSTTLLPAASPISPELGGVMPAACSNGSGSSSLHSKTRSLPPRTRSCIMPVALKTSLGEVGPGGLSNSNSDLTAYRTLHRGSGGPLFPRASPVGPVQAQTQGATSTTASLSLSSSAAQQVVQQQLLSVAAATAPSAEGAKALQWEALQALDFPPPPPLPLMRGPSLGEQEGGVFDRAYPHTVRPATRSLQSHRSHPGMDGDHDGFVDAHTHPHAHAQAHGFYTPNQPASRRVQHRSTLNRDQMQQMLLNQALRERNDPQQSQTQAQAGKQLYADFNAVSKEWSPPSMHRTNSEAEKELERWQANRERQAAAAASGDPLMASGSSRRRARDRDADEGALFEMDL